MGLNYRDGELCFGSKKVKDSIGSSYEHPFYLYDLDSILERFGYYRSCLPIGAAVHYAMKANGNPRILAALKGQGAAVDTVSQGEIQWALDAGFTPEDVVFSGVGKTKEEIRYAIKTQIKQINVESLGELARIAEIARELKQEAKVAFRINPNVDPETHPYITTGFKENKFGVDEESLPPLLELLAKNPQVKFIGLSMHIGSQILEVKDFRTAVRTLRLAFERLRSEGWPLTNLDVGGGVGINYRSGDEKGERELVASYGQMLSEELAGLDCHLMTEPGRWIVVRGGILVSQVQYKKETEHRKFIVVDSGMHHLLRPALYQAYHRVLPLLESKDREWGLRDVVGPICESSDFLAKDHTLPSMEEGEYLVVAEAGAYGFSMASGYNGHAMPEERFL